MQPARCLLTPLALVGFAGNALAAVLDACLLIRRQAGDKRVHGIRRIACIGDVHSKDAPAIPNIEFVIGYNFIH